ncbi:MAG: exodeoxyribonuclease V subunit alpha [Pseudomonas sp.]|nr:exodeoxyribonuclease V subunit alpha [Pseudomonas sp.]
MSLLRALTQAGALRTLDQALARTLQRLDPDTPDRVLAAAALASLAVDAGHAGFDPADPRQLVDVAIEWPALDEWLAALASSRWVATPGTGDDASAEDAPLVLERGVLYLRRYREYERRLALGLRRIGAHAPSVQVPGAQPPDADACAADALAALAPRFAQLFPAAADGDRQARAAAVALRHALVLVSGGPGTGKTTTITRLLALLVAQARLAGRPAPRIALAAPTGRAAERMAESVRAAGQALLDAGIDAADIAALPTAGTTLHRLLGTLPDSPRFRHDAGNPLPFDVVVVDEASMIDLPLMAKLVEAVPDGARLLLLGDPDQLPSVEAGDVLSGVLRAAGDGGAIAVDDALALQPLLGPPGADALPRAPAFAGRHVHLTRGYRQSAALQLAPLAAAVRDGDAGDALALLRAGALSGVHFHEGLADPLQARRDAMLAHWAAVADAADPTRALAVAAQLRVLTAVREGPQGARGLNARIEALLAARAPSGSGARRGAGIERYFHGRLLLVTENSPRHRLFNGDIGVCLHDAGGTPVAWFAGGSDGVRGFHPGALPAHDSAFAMTVHKAQGSEFDRVWLQLPRQDARVLSRELVYTAITRARVELHVCASEPVLRAALARHAGRVSGLAWRLRTPND